LPYYEHQEPFDHPSGCRYNRMFVSQFIYCKPTRLIGIVYLSLNDPHPTHLVFDRANCM
ncbi:hypothetical protein L873DRAFT_1805034, partial [Choiromyces venosus 120613-1]